MKNRSKLLILKALIFAGSTFGVVNGIPLKPECIVSKGTIIGDTISEPGTAFSTKDDGDIEIFDTEMVPVFA